MSEVIAKRMTAIAWSQIIGCGLGLASVAYLMFSNFGLEYTRSGGWIAFCIIIAAICVLDMAFGIWILFYPNDLISLDDRSVFFAKPKKEIRLEDIKTVSKTSYWVLGFIARRTGAVIIQTRYGETFKQRFVSEAEYAMNEIRRRIGQ